MSGGPKSPLSSLPLTTEGASLADFFSPFDECFGIRHCSVQIVLDGICPGGVVVLLLKRSELSPLEKIDVGDALDGVVDVWPGGAWP